MIKKSSIGTMALIIATIALVITAFSCKKETQPSNEEYVEGWTRVIGVKGTDTSSTPYIQGRTETVGLLLVEDAKLKAELMSFTPLPNGTGQYVVRMTNKQSCQVILRWMWEGLTIDNISPSNDVLTGNQIVEYTLIGDAKPGRIKVKAEKSNSSCSNSSTLILEITNIILPINFTSYNRLQKGSDVYITFSTQTPQDVDWFLVMWTPDGTKSKEVVKAYIASDPNTKSYKVSYPAVKKADLK